MFYSIILKRDTALHVTVDSLTGSVEIQYHTRIIGTLGYHIVPIDRWQKKT